MALEFILWRELSYLKKYFNQLLTVKHETLSRVSRRHENKRGTVLLSMGKEWCPEKLGEERLRKARMPCQDKSSVCWVMLIELGLLPSRDWEIGVVSFLMTTFQRDGSQVHERHILEYRRQISKRQGKNLRLQVFLKSKCSMAEITTL